MHIARALFEAGETPQRAARHLMRVYKVKDHLPPKDQLAGHAFFGGRTQIFRTGTFERVYRYDMRSAYPAALAYLASVYNAKVQMRAWNEPDWLLSPFAFREEDGTVGYPPFGTTWRWTFSNVHHTKESNPFGYLRELYALSVSGSGEEYVPWLKQAMRCTWGGLLLPGFECYSLEWAGQATALLHDWLYYKASPFEEHLLAWNVDSITSLVPIPFKIGVAMGDFRETILDRVTIDPGAFGPKMGHPQAGTDRWLSYWPPDEFRNAAAISAPYIYQGPNKRGERYHEGI